MHTLNAYSLLPRETIRKLPRIILTGAEELLIEQHRGLYSYDPTRIRIRATHALITVSGQKLTIIYFGVQDLLIHGSIHAIALESDQPC